MPGRECTGSWVRAIEPSMASGMLCTVVVCALAIVACSSPQVAAPKGEPARRALASSGAAAHRQWALSVGVNAPTLNSDLQRLTSAESDALRVAGVLSDRFGFDVEKLVGPDATRSRVLSLLESRFDQATDDDELLFFFSGHGTASAGPPASVGYLSVAGCDRKNPRSTCLTFGALRDLLFTRARAVLIVVDACNAAAIVDVHAETPVADLSPTPVDLEGLRSKHQRAVLSAAGFDNRGQPLPAFDGAPFSDALLKGLSGTSTGDGHGADVDGDGVLTSLELSSYVASRMRDWKGPTGEREFPFYSANLDSGGGEFLFVPASGDAAVRRDARREINLARNRSPGVPDRPATPHPYLSSKGWHGGAKTWEIVDGYVGCPPDWFHRGWACGLAFTGGEYGFGVVVTAGNTAYNLPGGVACGERQATIELGQCRTVSGIRVFYHGAEQAPRVYSIDVRGAGGWKTVDPKPHESCESGPGYSCALTDRFPERRADAVRLRFDNCPDKNVSMAPEKKILHGWIDEFEVLGYATPRDRRGDFEEGCK